MNKKAIIAMSGGVDSSVAAYLMVQQGYDCAGATLKLYDNPQCSYPGHRACCTPSDTEDARSVAARLGMLYYVFPMQEKFHESVIDKFADTYLHGGTPNPCIDCNRFLKFSALLDKARELGCDNIRVNAVAPGITRTDMVAALPEAVIKPLIATIPLGRVGEPEDIANAFLFLASDMASYVTGEILSVDGAARS